MAEQQNQKGRRAYCGASQKQSKFNPDEYYFTSETISLSEVMKKTGDCVKIQLGRKKNLRENEKHEFLITFLEDDPRYIRKENSQVKTQGQPVTERPANSPADYRDAVC
jgi:hypothetical protein